VCLCPVCLFKSFVRVIVFHWLPVLSLIHVPQTWIHMNLKCNINFMYIARKLKCQLSFNWRLNLIEVCATQSWYKVLSWTCFIWEVKLHWVDKMLSYIDIFSGTSFKFYLTRFRKLDVNQLISCWQKKYKVAIKW